MGCLRSQLLLLTLVPCAIHGETRRISAENISAAYQVQLEIGSRAAFNFEELEQKLAEVVELAFNTAIARRLHQPVELVQSTGSTNFSTEIVKVSDANSYSVIGFVARLQQQLLSADVIAADIRLLTLSQISALTHLPVISISTASELAQQNESNWWIIIAVLCAGVMAILVGWCLLFVYYNSCGRATISCDITKTVYLTDKTTQSSFEQGKLQPSENGCTPGEEFFVEATANLDYGAGDGKSNKRKEPPSLPPLVIDTEECSDVRPRVEKTLSRDTWASEDRIDVDSISTNLDDLPVETTKATGRPKTAGKSRPVRTPEGHVLRYVKQWNEYVAGDAVAEVYGVTPTAVWAHPTPSNPTSDGIIEFDSRSEVKKF